MKNNYKALISYDGTRYQGWERQPGCATIQGKIEDVLRYLDENGVEVTSAGRTDAGVHAKGMVANFLMDTEMSAQEICDYMNLHLPDDIVILELKEASERFHARYKATGKTYCYTCYDGPGKPIFDRKYVWRLEQSLDIESMKAAASYLIGSHDFRSFCKAPPKNKSTVRNVDQIDIKRKGSYVTLSFHGDGFLRNMVRIMVGTLVEVGLGKKDPKQVQSILESTNRIEAGATAPAQGLCLIKVDY